MASEGALPGQQQPGAGRAADPADRGLESPAERRERGLRALSVNSRLLAGSCVFFFMSFLFAYFYLRSLNNENLWRPHGLKPDQALGGAFVGCLILSMLATIIAGRRAQAWKEWTPAGAAAVVLGLAAVALQCIEFTKQNFGPTNGAFASVFCGWLAFYLMFVLASMYHIEIQVATELRERRKPTARAGEGVTEYEDPDKLVARPMEGVVFLWGFLVAIGVVTYVVLYLI